LHEQRRQDWQHQAAANALHDAASDQARRVPGKARTDRAHQNNARAAIQMRLPPSRSMSQTRSTRSALHRGSRPWARDLLRHEMLMTLRPVPEETIAEIVDDIFLPLVRRTSEA
jgi:hypothetical protein